MHTMNLRPTLATCRAVLCDRWECLFALPDGRLATGTIIHAPAEDWELMPESQDSAWAVRDRDGDVVAVRLTV